MTDIYQKKYLEHQKNKKSQLEKKPEDTEFFCDYDFEGIVDKRRSIRIFQEKKIRTDLIDVIIDYLIECPSSCNRGAIKLMIVNKKRAKEILSGILVGGRGWIQNADTIFLFFADMRAYKSPNEVSFMPYLDAGVKMITACYGATMYEIGSCIVNPNIRPINKNRFNKLFNKKGYKFCGAVALGYPGIEAERPDKQNKEEFLIYEDRVNSKR